MPVNVLILRDSSGIYGAERVILTLARNIDHNRYKYTLCCLQGPGSNSKELVAVAESIGLPYFLIPVRGKVDFCAFSRIRNIIQSEKIDIIHSHDFKSDFYGFMATLFSGVKRVTTAHGSTRDSIVKKLYLFFTEYILYFFYHKIIAVSEKVALDLKYSDKVTVIQNGIDPALMEYQKAKRIMKLDIIPENAIIFGVIGRLFPDKGQIEFIEAFSRLFKTNKNLYAILAGEGPYRGDIELKIKQKGLEQNIFLTGFVQDVKEIYERINYLVIPSFREGLPYTLLEAMSLQIPVIATAVGDIPQLIIPEETGILIEPQKVDEIEKAMHFALFNEQLMQRMAVRAKEKVLSLFSAKKMAEATENIYSEIMHNL